MASRFSGEASDAMRAGRRIQGFVEGPKTVFLVCGALLALCVLSLTLGYSNPLQRMAPEQGAYLQSVTFSYKAAVITPTPVYPSGFVTTGEPIYSGLVNKVIIHFAYQFSSSLPHRIKGTIEVRALLLSQTDTWQQLATVSPLTSFQGDRATAASSEGLDGLYSLINSVSTQTGNADAAYTADIQLVVHIAGTVGGKPVNKTFSPVVPFAVTKTTITIVAATTAIAPGATYVPPSASAEMSATLHPSELGSIPHLVPDTIEIVKYTFTVAGLRVLGVIFGVVALLLISAYDVLRRHTPAQTAEAMIVAQTNALMVHVESTPLAGGGVHILNFVDLAHLADYLEQPILLESNEATSTFTVDDGIHRYVFTSPEHPFKGLTVPSSALALQAKSDRDGEPRAHLGAIQRSVGAIVALVVVALAVTSFTASTNVPASSVGTSNQLLQVAQLTPTGCSSLSLTSLVIHSGTFANASSHALVLASAGNDTITDTGSGNCIAAGSGTNTITGTATDICVSGPTLNVASACPTGTSPTTTTSAPKSDGVVVSAGADNYNNYGGQDRLIFTNVASITSLHVTITVVQGPGITFGSQSNSFPGGALTQSWSNPTGSFVYSYVLGTGQIISADYPNGTLYAQFQGTGTAHPASGDTWSVTSTSGGVTSTQSGVF